MTIQTTPWYLRLYNAALKRLGGIKKAAESAVASETKYGRARAKSPNYRRHRKAMRKMAAESRRWNRSRR